MTTVAICGLQLHKFSYHFAYNQFKVVKMKWPPFRGIHFTSKSWITNRKNKKQPTRVYGHNLNAIEIWNGEKKRAKEKFKCKETIVWLRCCSCCCCSYTFLSWDGVNIAILSIVFGYVFRLLLSTKSNPETAANAKHTHTHTYNIRHIFCFVVFSFCPACIFRFRWIEYIYICWIHTKNGILMSCAL